MHLKILVLLSDSKKVQNILGLFMTCVTTWIHVLHSVHYVLVQVRMCCDRPLLCVIHVLGSLWVTYGIK